MRVAGVWMGVPGRTLRVLQCPPILQGRGGGLLQLPLHPARGLPLPAVSQGGGRGRCATGAGPLPLPGHPAVARMFRGGAEGVRGQRLSHAQARGMRQYHPHSELPDQRGHGDPPADQHWSGDLRGL
ncbi:uncharacterized protein LOC143285615 [Babylonia areolata]|uniref:uncharacterized protein LOC143285615 n=1 Tax=Babylonia areolata TaxID=304850 RepID=UPI003FD1FDA7